MSEDQKKKALRELEQRIHALGDGWLYPEEPNVAGFLGVGPIFIVGDQPSTAEWGDEHPHRRALYDLLASEQAGDCHLTDIYKRRGPAGELRRGLPRDFGEQLEIFRAEVRLLNPHAILAMGRDAHELLLKHTPELTNRLSRVWHFGSVRHGKIKEFQGKLSAGIAAARRLVVLNTRAVSSTATPRSRIIPPLV